ncbi:MAG: ATP-binding protein [Reyranella sp.]|nr:ATP-binding protein [Reyranella sp.]
MKFIHRDLETHLRTAVRRFPAVVLTGPRRAGKTSLLRRSFPAATYVLLEAPDIVARFRSDPQGFLDSIETPAILDEVQNTPEILAHVRARIDDRPRRTGQWLLTGSQEAPLMRGVTESMAGRAAILQLLPLSARETPKVDLLRGGYPEVLARPAGARLWFSSYLQTYLERDVRAITAVRDLATFRRFLALVASRHGQILNRSDLAGPLGVSVPTIGHWLDILEATAQIMLVPPFFENFGKRLTKSPRLYVADSGLACHLLGIESSAELTRSPFLGAIFEGLVASEIAKAQANRGQRRELYHFRDEQGLEVDFVVPGRSGALDLIECKAGRTATPAMAGPMRRLAEAIRKTDSRRPAVSMTLVHQPPRSVSPSPALAPGVRALPWRTFVASLA